MMDATFLSCRRTSFVDAADDRSDATWWDLSISER